MLFVFVMIYKESEMYIIKTTKRTWYIINRIHFNQIALILKNYTHLSEKSQQYCCRLLHKMQKHMSNDKICSQYYHGSKHELIFKCPNGHVFKRCPCSVIHKAVYSCPICKRQYKHQKYFRNLKSFVKKHAHGYHILDVYCKWPGIYWTKMICPKGHIFTRRCDVIKNFHLCPKCDAHKASIEREYSVFIHSKRTLIKRLNRHHLKLICVLPTNQRKPLCDHYVIIECPHHHMTKRLVANLIGAYYCSTCLEHKEQYNYYLKFKKFFNKYYPNYSIVHVTKHLHSFSHIVLKCPKGHVYFTYPSSVYERCGCTICQASKGERLFRRLLIKHRIPYTYADTHTLSDYGRLHLDFVIPHKCAIEIDGDYHFEPKLYHHSMKYAIKCLKIRQHNDNRKDKYCFEKHIPLLRILYVEGTNRRMYIIRAFKWLYQHHFDIPNGIVYLY